MESYRSWSKSETRNSYLKTKRLLSSNSRFVFSNLIARKEYLLFNISISNIYYPYCTSNCRTQEVFVAASVMRTQYVPAGRVPMVL